MKKLTISTTDILRVALAAAHTTNPVRFHLGYSQMNATTGLESTESVRADSNGTTNVTLIAGVSAKRQHIDYLHVYNDDTVAHTLTFQVADSGGTNARTAFPKLVLQRGESATLTDAGWKVADVNGREKKVAEENTGYTGRAMSLLKISTAAEAVGVGYCTSKDSGFPGAWAVGTSGLAGRATDGTTSADNGCIPWQNPASGSIYLTQFSMSSTVAHFHWLMDVLWVNNGIVVTTTTAQTINSVAFPARDVNGSTNGEGVMVGILVTTATTNAAAITNTTMSYTNSDGTAGRTATMASFPATAVAGTIVWFLLAAGDKGVRSIQSITLGTSYAGGAISLVAARWIAAVPMTVVNLGAQAFGANAQNPGVRLYNGSCLLHWYVASATTATTSQGAVTLMER
jgi:hypothetical protein